MEAFYLAKCVHISIVLLKDNVPHVCVYIYIYTYVYMYSKIMNLEKGVWIDHCNNK